jgi:hypothetical protein
MSDAPPRARTLAAALLVAAALLLGAAGCGSSSDSSSDTGTTSATGGGTAPAGSDVADQELAEELLRLLQAEDAAGLEAFLSPALILQRADGTHLGKEAYLANPAVVDEYQVTDVVGTRTGDTRAIRSTVVVTEAIDGQPVTKDPVPRLSTFAWDGTRWQLVAHANFAATGR